MFGNTWEIADKNGKLAIQHFPLSVTATPGIPGQGSVERRLFAPLFQIGRRPDQRLSVVQQADREHRFREDKCSERLATQVGRL